MRRTVLLGLLLTAGGLLMTVAACGSDAPPPVPAIEQVRGDLYVIMGGDPTDRATFSGGNVAVYVMDQGVAVVDSKLPGYGQQIIDQIRTVTDKPILAMFHTHTHNDHAGSTPEFPDTIEVITHENINASLTRETCLPVTNCQTFKGENAKYLPQTTFSEKASVWFGDDRIDLYHFGPAHTNGDTLVVFPGREGDAFGRHVLAEAPAVHRHQQRRQRPGVSRDAGEDRGRHSGRGHDYPGTHRRAVHLA